MIGCLFSGGKDSTLAIHKAVNEGMNVDLLITVVSENDFSYMFHKPGIGFSELQANALGIKQMVKKTKGEKEAELEDLYDVIKESGVEVLITGATASVYQKNRIDKICSELNVKHISPLWHIDPLKELNEIADTFDAIITQVSADGFDESYLGSRIDSEMIEKLKLLNKKNGINLTFEGGEAETFVLDAPLFRKKIRITKSHKEWRHNFGRYVIEEAHLEEKQAHA